MSADRPSYPSDVSDEEWAVVAPYLALPRESSSQRDHDLREVFNGLRFIVKTGALAVHAAVYGAEHPARRDPGGP